MALNITDSLFAAAGRVSPAVNILSYTDEDATKSTRVVISKSSYTKEDGSVVTTTRCSDGTTETTETDGDSVVLSAEAQNLFSRRL